MAASQISKVFSHSRSISLPSTAHPVAVQFDEQLCRLRSSQATSTSSSPSVTYRLTSLTELYGLVDELLQLPSNQQSLSQIQAMLDGSLTLLDTCSTSRDVLLQSKEQLQDIQSKLRRRSSCESNITSEVAEYLKARKTVKKVVNKCLKNTKESSKSDETRVSEYFLNDVQDITADILTSLLSYIGGTKSRTSWSVVTKLIHKKEASVAQTTEFEAVDATLESLVCHKKIEVNVDNIRNQMVKLETEIEKVDEVLECLFRHLVKNRSTLLNILSN